MRMACDELNDAMNDLYDAFMHLENYCQGLSDEEWKTLDDMASDIRKTVGFMANHLRNTIKEINKGDNSDV